jgi:hypothetical protein
MALFGTQRDAKFLASINAELLNAIVDTEVEFYKLVIEQSNSNIYGESISKAYYESILIPALIAKEGKTGTMDDYGYTYTRTAQFGISRDILEKADFYPEVGDVIKWDAEYYQLDNVDANEYFVGKNPDTWPNGDKFGYSVSVLCDTHVTRQTPTNIRKMRFGTPDDAPSYKGYA